MQTGSNCLAVLAAVPLQQLLQCLHLQLYCIALLHHGIIQARELCNVVVISCWFSAAVTSSDAALCGSTCTMSDLL